VSSERVSDILEALDAREEKQAKKKTRTKANTETKKVKKLTKKEQQILDIEMSLVIPDNYILINTPELLERLVNYYKAYKTMFQGDAYVFLDTETYGLNNWKDGLISIQLGFMSEQYFYIPMRPFKHQMSKDIPTLDFNTVADALRPLLEADKMLVLANAKFDIHVLYNWANIDITWNIFWDTTIAGGLLNENKPKGLKEWYQNYALPWLIETGKLKKEELHRPTFKFGALFDKIPYDEIPHRIALYYGAHDVFMTHWVFMYQKQIFENPAFQLDRVWKLFREVEMPLIPIFVLAERRGVEIDSKFLQDVIGKVLEEKLHEIIHGKVDPETGEKIEKGIYDYLGGTIKLKKNKTRQKNGIKYKVEVEVEEEFNLKSPQQLSYKLYEEHKILEPTEEYDRELKKKVLKTPTSKKVLTRNKKKHPVIGLILEYRGLSKLIDAFCKKLPDDAVDGVIHASYNQLVRTGRVSCSNPNLQQIPSKFDLIRYAFRAPEGRLLVSADFSQQELRWLAIFTKEPSLIEVFQNGLDMHSRVTCQVHGLNYDMFEQIRNYKGDSDEETEANIKAAIERWAGTQDIKYAIQYLATKEKSTLDPDVCDKNTIETLASFFELLRKKMKSVVFGVVYGITEIGLADQIEDTKEEAKKLIDGFKSGLPNYLRWEVETHRELLSQGFVETVLGRKRRFGETIAEAMQDEVYKKRGWHWKIEKAKRQSTNVKIQGSSADQSKLAMVLLFYPRRPDGTICYDREEWLREGYKSQLEQHDIHIILQVHDELVFDAPVDTPWEVYKEIANTMCNAIPNDAGVTFKSDIEASPYWGGKFSPEQIQQMLDGKLDWHVVFEEEVQKKLAKFGIEYTPGTFFEIGEEEAVVAAVFAKEGLEYKAGAVEDDDEDDSEEEVA
jgi:DNA polymerase I